MLRESFKNPVNDAKINIIGTINLLESSRKHNVKKFIYTSTGGARVGEPDYLPVDEKHPINPCSPYGISKHTAEHYVWMYNQIYNLDYLIFCFGNVYGPRDDPKCKRVTSLFAYQMLKNIAPTIFGDGKQTRDFIYVEDLANFIVKSLNKSPEHKLFHLANGKQTSVNEIFNSLKELSGFAGEPIHEDSIKGEVRDIVLDTTLAQEELGWKPKHTMNQGLELTFKWLKNNQKMFGDIK
jgi:UDP-glucose 4-epimerase